MGRSKESVEFREQSSHVVRETARSEGADFFRDNFVVVVPPALHA